MSNTYLIIYISLWAVVFAVYQRSRKYFGVASLIILSYFLYAVASYFLYNNFYFRGEYGELTLAPFLYLFLLLMIALYPIMKFKEEQLTLVAPNINLLNIISYIYIISAVVILPMIFDRMKEGITLLIVDPTGGEQLYLEMHSAYGEAAGRISNIFSIIYNIFSPIAVLIFFYYLTLKKKKYGLLIGFFIAISTTLLYPVSKGSRTEVVMSAFSIVMAFFLMKPFMTKKLIKLVYKVGLAIGGIVATFFLLLTISRFGNSAAGTEGGLINYTGQCNLNFNLYVLAADGTRNGDRTCNTFKALLGWNDIPRTIMETRNKYSSLGIDDGSFYTFVGDFVLDFGPTITFLLFVLFSLIIKSKTRTPCRVVKFHQLLLIYFSATVCMQGGMYLFYYSYVQNLVIIAFVLCYLAFKYENVLFDMK